MAASQFKWGSSMDGKPCCGTKEGCYVRNPNIQEMDQDILYHFALGTNTHDLRSMFKDVKFVCMAGSRSRIKRFAIELLSELGLSLPAGQGLINIASGTDRYVMYKVGPVLAISHGMGMPSISIMLHETVKLLHHAGCYDVTFFRIGTSGGLGVKPGSVVITESCVDGLFRPFHEMHIMGKVVQRPATLSAELSDELLKLAKSFTHFDTVKGKTLCTNDFYEEQGRLDGAICHHSEADKMEFLRKAMEQGVKNIEMESLCFASVCNHLNIKAAVVCVAIVNRLMGDQISTPHEELEDFNMRAFRIMTRYFRGSGLCGDCEPFGGGSDPDTA